MRGRSNGDRLRDRLVNLLCHRLAVHESQSTMTMPSTTIKLTIIAVNRVVNLCSAFGICSACLHCFGENFVFVHIEWSLQIANFFAISSTFGITFMVQCSKMLANRSDDSVVNPTR